MSSNFRTTDMFGSYNNRLPQGKINPTKGVGLNAYQTGNTSKDVRGFWNKDYTNDMPAPFGKPRPIKHFRKGRVIPHYIEVANPTNTNELITVDYNEMRNVKSSVLNKMVSQLLYLPGSYSIVPNTVDGSVKSIENCKTCIATTVVSNYRPINNLTEKPEPNVENKLLCCNEEYKARKRVLPANTITKPNYYTTNHQYLQNRCQTFQQRQYNFITGTNLTNETVKSILSTIVKNPDNIDLLISTSKPGSPLSYFNDYVGQCYCNGALLDTTMRYVVSELILGLYNNSLINQNEYNLLNSLQFSRIIDLTNFINTTFSSDRSTKMTEYIYYTIDSNVTLSNLLEPTNASLCGRVYYKPSNYQFAVEGAVMSSTRNLKLNVDTINKNNAINKRLVGVENAEILANTGSVIQNPFILGAKAKYGTTSCQNGCFVKKYPLINPTTSIPYIY
jgi:hypothetical protein